MSYHTFTDENGLSFGSFEVFEFHPDYDKDRREKGFYWWPCFPDCLPDTDDDNPYGYGVVGTYDSCNECGGEEPAPQGYMCRRSPAGDSCVPCPQDLYISFEDGCMFTSLEECEAAWGSESCKEEEDIPREPFYKNQSFLGDLEEPKSLTTMAQTLQKRAGIIK